MGYHQLPRDASLIGHDKHGVVACAPHRRDCQYVSLRSAGAVSKNSRPAPSRELNRAARLASGAKNCCIAASTSAGASVGASSSRSCGPVGAVGVSMRTSNRRPSFSGAEISITRSGATASTSTSSVGVAAVALDAVPVRASVIGTTRVTLPLGRPLQENDAEITGCSRSSGAATTATRNVATSDLDASRRSVMALIAASVIRKWCVATSQISSSKLVSSWGARRTRILRVLARARGDLVRIHRNLEHGARAKRRFWREVDVRRAARDRGLYWG